MAGPIITAAVAIGKKVAVDVLTEPEKLAKVILIILGIIIGIALIFISPTYFVTSTPVIFLNNPANADLTQKQLKIISTYQVAPISTDLEAIKWINDKKVAYSYADDIVTNYNFSLTWHELISIDSVRLNQDFSKVSESDINALADQFLLKNSRTESYTVEEPYTETVIITDPDTGISSPTDVPKTRTVTKTRAIITIDTVDFYTMLDMLNFSSEDKEIAINIYRNIQAIDIEGNFNIYDDVDFSNLQEYPAGSADIPYFNQTDIRWGNEKYGLTGTIKSSGCGPTALSMVIAGLTKRNNINPGVIADWSYKNGHRAEGQGSYWSLMTEGGESFGLTVKPVSRKDPESVLDALSSGYPVIVSMGPGHFTKYGHFIVLYGLADKNKVLVHDPASVKRSNKLWDIKTIISESSTNGGVNGSPFWVFSLKE